MHSLPWPRKRRGFPQDSDSAFGESMKRSFFARYSLLILCVVFFLVPFALRGARLSLERMENNVKDWLPSSFKETDELSWFARNFVGEQAFVLLTWQDCSEQDESFRLFVEKLRNEIAGEPTPMPSEEELSQLQVAQRTALEKQLELERARQLGDRLGLYIPPDTFPNWGGLNEKWLRGRDHWYYITPEGELYRWGGKANVVEALTRIFQRGTGSFQLEGEYIDTFGRQGNSIDQNDFHTNPRRLTARVLKSVTTGPDVLEELSKPGGPLWPIGGNLSDEERADIARREAIQRLKGSLFENPPYEEFTWKADDLANHLSNREQSAMPDQWQAKADIFLTELISDRFAGDRTRLQQASLEKKERYWNEMFQFIGCEPPGLQTCIVVTLSEAGTEDLRHVIGRGILGKPRGKLIDLAAESNVTPPALPPLTPFGKEADAGERVLRMGGPPVDNVAIDEEGQVTLVRLVGFSVLLGLGLSYLSFRSVKLTIMVFMVGGISAVASLSIVWWSGSSVDAILMSMPSLVYVLGLSGAIHIVNYYRDAEDHYGRQGAIERALGHGWLPCTLAAFTTSLGLISLYKSNIIPIKKFGLFSAVGVMATVILLFTYLPAALAMWPPKKRRQPAEGQRNFDQLLGDFWEAVGRMVVKNHAFTATACIVIAGVVGYGLTKINTDIQLLKLFDGNAKIIRDYYWLEEHVGKIVPMEIIVAIDPSKQRPDLDELKQQELSEVELNELTYQLRFSQRMAMVAHIQRAVENVFGEQGQDIVGRAISSATFAPDILEGSSYERGTINSILERNAERYMGEDYLTLDPETQAELWRISVRLGALNDVDYGTFVGDLKQVVEPVISAYEYEEKIRRILDKESDQQSVLVLGNPRPWSQEGSPQPGEVDQVALFSQTLGELLYSKGFRERRDARKRQAWHDPARELTEAQWDATFDAFDCVVLVGHAEAYNLEYLQAKAKHFVDARDLAFSEQAGSLSSKEREAPYQVTYTGVVPIVYKAQRTLLTSLIDSIGWAFGLIAVVMMFLLRRSRLEIINLTGGMTSMIPNLFPVIVVFGAMGHANILVDIGTMMTASVAMGVAVDDTIHFLTWFRGGVASGLSRKDAILLAYRRVGTAMTQTTLIGGIGLSVFAFSTFTPTQRFGTMMLTLLAAALVGDLVLLPALLAGPLGRFFEKRDPSGQALDSTWGVTPEPAADATSEPTVDSAPHPETDDRDRGPGPHRGPVGDRKDVRVDGKHRRS